MVQAPKPECQMGITQSQLEAFLNKTQLSQFNYWMSGQTGGICDGQEYNHETKRYHRTYCGPHGYVVYQHDLQRWLDHLPIID